MVVVLLTSLVSSGGLMALEIPPMTASTATTPVMMTLVFWVNCLFIQTNTSPAGKQNSSETTRTQVFSYQGPSSLAPGPWNPGVGSPE